MIDPATRVLLAPSLLLLGLLTPSAPALPAPCEACTWQDRGDRWEGVVDREQVSGASFELLGVHRRGLAEEVPASERLYLSFWLPAPRKELAIEVWQPARLYRMRPLPREYGAGRQGFDWPRGAVVDRLGLAVSSLYTRVEAGGTYYPALLARAPDALPAEGYTFLFQAGAGIDAECTVAPREEDRVVRRFDCFADHGGTVAFEWDGRDEGGEAVPAGVYVLTITGEMLAETLRPLARRIPFFHPGPP